jgi:GntR family transcriptional regulator, rspAB operon transcriptional repressor
MEDVVTLGDSGDPKQPLTERVYQLLKSDILHARLLPGATVLEPELATRFEVSKTPVREALRLLAQDGWVTVLPRKGYLVRSLGLDDLRDVFQLRELLEPEFAGEAATRFTQLRDDRGVGRALREQRSAADDLDRALTSAGDFHVRIAEVAGNARAARIIANLVDEVTRLHHLMPSLEPHIWSSEELDAHERITEAIVAGNRREASRAMRDHLRTTHQALVSVFGVPRRTSRS